VDVVPGEPDTRHPRDNSHFNSHFNYEHAPPTT